MGFYTNTSHAIIPHLIRETVKKYNTDNQLESTTSHLPMTGASETKGPKMNILDEPSVPSTPLTRPPRMPSKAAQRNSDHDLMMGEVAGGALSTTSSTNALDLDALDKLNQERLKRLALLESSHELRGNRPRKETNDILDAFMKNELSRATSAETLMADTMLK